MFFKLIFYSSSVDFLSLKHSVFPMDRIPFFFSLLNLLNSLHSLNISFSVVSNRLHLNLLHLQSSIVHELFIMDFSISFGPFHFLRIVLCLEVIVALRPAKLKKLTVISHELNSMSRIDGRTAEIAFFYSHL